jgi:hypothetical protein
MPKGDMVYKDKLPDQRGYYLLKPNYKRLKNIQIYNYDWNFTPFFYLIIQKIY